MKFSITLLVTVLYLFSSVEADISTTSPFNGITWNGGESELITWVDNGVDPKLEAITGPVTVDLMAGGSQNQVKVTNIGSTLATAKQIGFNVPSNVGPSGNFYFIKYTAGDHTAFSGTFSIKNVNGAIPGFDPNNPNGSQNSTATASASTLSSPTQSPNPYATSASSTGTGAGYGAPQNTNTPNSGNTPASASTPNSSNTSAGLSSLPSEISSSAINNLVPSFASIATAVIALTFTYLY